MDTPSPPLTIGGTVLKESVDLDTLGVTNDSEIPFAKHLCSVTRTASQRLGIFRGFVLLSLGYCSAVSCSAADTHL